jgi:hypothetical protein
LWLLVAGKDEAGASVLLELVAEGSPQAVTTETSARLAMERGRCFMARAVRRGITAMGVAYLAESIDAPP